MSIKDKIAKKEKTNDNGREPTKNNASEANGEGRLSVIKRKLDNFFYHYKFQFFACLFLIFVLVWVIVSGIGKNTQDAYIGYIGDYSYSPREQEEKGVIISDALNLNLKGKGKSEIIFYSSVYMSDEQIKEYSDAVSARGDEYKYSPKHNENEFLDFLNELEIGDTAVWIVSREVYERIDKDLLLPHAEALGYKHEAAVDSYALDCSKIDFTKEHMRENCSGTYLIMRASRKYSTIMGTDEMNRDDEKNRQIFCAIAEYKS